MSHHPLGYFCLQFYAGISLETALHFTVTSAFLGLGQTPQGSETHVQCQNPRCQKQPGLISISKLPIKTCWMLRGAASPPTPTAQQAQASVSKAKPGSALSSLPSQPGLSGTSCSRCCLCQQPPEGASTQGPVAPGHPHPVPAGLLAPSPSLGTGTRLSLPAELQSKPVIKSQQPCR